MLRIAIIDDDQTFLSVAHKAIKEIANIKTSIHKFDNAESFLLSHNKFFYQVVFLDYDLSNGITGFDILKTSNNTLSDPIIIMVTSFDNVSIVTEAFKYKIFRYIFKKDFESKLPEILCDVSYEVKSRFEMIIVKDKHTTYNLKVEEVYGVYSISYYCIFVLNDNSLQIRMPLKDIVDTLVMNHFVQASSNSYVNLRHIMRFDKSSIYLDNGTNVKLSRSGYKSLSELFNRYRV